MQTNISYREHMLNFLAFLCSFVKLPKEHFLN